MKNLALNKTTRGFDLPQYRLNCTKFGKLNFREVIKVVATRCHILKLKCTKIRFRMGPWGAYRPLAGFKGPTSKGMEKKRRGRAERDVGKGEAGDGEWASPIQNFRLKSCTAYPPSILH